MITAQEVPGLNPGEVTTKSPDFRAFFFDYLAMEHRFFEKSKSSQRAFYRQLILISVCLILFITVAAFYLHLYALIGLCALWLLIIAPFIDLPSGVKQGNFIYYAPLFITEKEKNGVVVIHGGTLFDYYFNLEKGWSGTTRVQYILYNYVVGLLALVDQYSEKGQTDLILKGTSYFFNEKNARKIGFKKVAKDGLQFFILLINFVPLSISISMARKGLSVPRFSNINSFEATVADVLAHKEYLEALRERLGKSLELL